MSDPCASIANDEEQRRRALHIGGSFVVQAPAGSGKTELLVRRFLSLLAVAERPESVLAITFTRKAAGEMRERILAALRSAAAQPRPDEPYGRDRHDLAQAVLARAAQKNWHLLDSPARLQVFTIDGLCSRIVGSMPLMSRLGGTPRVVEDASPMMREAVRRTLRRAGEDGLRRDLAVLFERYELGADRLESQLMAMLACRDRWTAQTLAAGDDSAAWVAEVEKGFEQAIQAEVAGMAAALPARYAAQIHDIAIRTRSVMTAGDCLWPGLGAANLLTAPIPDREAWRQAAELLLTRSNQYRKSTVRNCDKALREDYLGLLETLDSMPAPGRELLLESFVLARKLPRLSQFSALGKEALEAFARVLLHAYAELWIVFGRRGEVDFAEIALRATAALGSGETMEKLDARVEHLLVDEFQDTSVLQCALLKGLTSGWQHGDGRTLFLVGDPMQSIYRFRKAEVGLFLAARQPRRMFPSIDLQPLTLSVNFRSDRSVIDWINSVFSRLFSDRDDASRGMVSYAPAEPSPRAGDGTGTRVLLWGDAPVEGEPKPEPADGDAIEASGLAALMVSEWIPAARARGGRVAVLVRARSHATLLMRELAQAGVRVRAPGLDMLCDRMIVRDLESLARTILHPADRVSMLALLRGPLVGLGLDDLARLVEPGIATLPPRAAPRCVTELLRDDALVATLSDDGRVRAQRVRRVLRQARRNPGSRPADIVVRSAWLRLGGPLLAGVEGALDAEAFFDLLSATARDGLVDLDALSQDLAAREANVDPDPDIDVEILTMHKSKGLEFDTVVLPALTRKTGGSNPLPLAMETDPCTGELRMVAPREARGRDDDDKDKHDFVVYREKRREKEENLRVLYVATTRARHCLVLSGAAARLNARREAGAGSLFACLAAAVTSADVESMPASGTTRQASPAPLRITREFALPGLPAPLRVRPVVSRLPSQSDGFTPVMMATTKRAAHVGTVFHALAERIATEGLDSWPLDRVRTERDWIVHRLRASGVLAEEMAASAGDVVEAVTALLSDERGRWSVAAHEDAHSEWSLLGLEGDTLTPAIIDRTFVDGEDRWIVDFKTGRPDPGSMVYRELDAMQAAAAYIASHRDAYARQLGRYRELLEHEGARLPFLKTARRVRLGLFFAQLPAGTRWVEIEDGQAGN